jgi:hypothetical protein
MQIKFPSLFTAARQFVTEAQRNQLTEKSGGQEKTEVEARKEGQSQSSGRRMNSNGREILKQTAMMKTSSRNSRRTL